jgi:hypothetical protein
MRIDNMKHTNISIAGLKTLDACQEAIAKIERTASNYTSPRDFVRCAPCELSKGAVNKIAAINRKYDKLWAVYEIEMEGMI